MSIVNDLLRKIAEAVTVEGAATRAQIAAGLGETVNAVRVTGARYEPLYPNAMLNGGPCRLLGWSLRETSGSAPAVLTMYDARTPDDPMRVVAVVNLAAGAVSNHGMPGPGVSLPEALFVAVTGTVQGSLFLGSSD